MTEPRKNALLQFPGIVFDRLQHIATVVRFDHDRCAAAQLLGDQCSDVSKIQHGRDFYAVMRGGETKVIHRVMGHREWMKVDLADAEIVSGINFYHPVTQGIGAPPGLVARDVSTL